MVKLDNYIKVQECKVKLTQKVSKFLKLTAKNL